MIYRFDHFELDGDHRELRRGGQAIALQPQAFNVLEYLVRNRERAVSKKELLETLWPGVVVGAGSVQRAISLARAALGDDGKLVRTIPKHGYRFVARVDVDAGPSRAAWLRPRFARSGDMHIAFHTMGEGDLDIVLVPGWVFPMRACLDHPAMERWIAGLTKLGRVILFDKRGTGLSDRVKELPTLEQRMDDLRAVLDAAGSREAVLLGVSEGGPLCLLFATSYPERTRGLILEGAFARWSATSNYPHGWSAEHVAELRQYIETSWGSGHTIRAIVESHAADPDVQQWAARAEQEGASPGAALELLEMNLRIDVRPILRTVSVPTAVLHHSGDSVISAENSRYLAAHIPGARLGEHAGKDHLFVFEGGQHVTQAVEWIVACGANAHERFLTTVLAVDGDGAGPDPASVDAVVGRFRGVPAGPRWTWSFDGPQRAIQCAHALLSTWPEPTAAGVGVHTGEVQRQGSELAGDAVAAASAIARAARGRHVWVSRVVRDLVHGSPLAFDEVPSVALGGGRTIAVLASAVPAP